MKKLLSTLFLALVASVSAIYAQSGSCGDNLTWTYSNGTLTISGTGVMYPYAQKAPWYNYRSSIKSIVINDGVTSIGYGAFGGCTSLTSVTIGNSVTSIGRNAFYECSSLTSVTIPNSVKSIGSSAFYGCSSLASITIPNSVTSIGDNAFYNCSSLTSVTIGNSVTSIGERAFNCCSSLTSVTIGNSVTSIGEGAFSNCISLTSVTIPNSVTSIGNAAFEYCSSLTSVTIPNSVTSIGYWAFGGCSSLNSVHVNDIAAWCGIIFEDYSSNPLYYAHNLYLSGKLVKDLVIPNGVAFIGNSAFCECSSLTSVTIPNSVTSIGGSAFSGCSSLTSITIPNSVTSIGEHAFHGCSSLTSVTIPNSVTSIGNYAFSGCSSLISITIPNSVTSIGNSAFEGCNNITSVIWNAKNCNSYNFGSQVTSFTFGNEVEVIPSSLCEGMEKLTSITIPNGVTSIGSSAFRGCNNITSVTWNAKNCNSYNFGSQVTSFEFGNEVEVIPSSLCQGMTKLTSITIPNSVTSIGERAFYGCTSVTSILIPQKVNKIGSMAFAACPSRTSIRVDSGNSTYDSRNNCNGIVEKSTNKLIVGCKTTVIPNDVKCIGDYAFYGGASSLTSITIPASVESIGEYAFGECPRLYDIYSYANRPPLAKQSSFSNYNAFVYVPCESQRYYVLDEIWSNFNNYECISSDNVTTDEIVVTPSENEANVIWPTVSGAATYELVIKDKDGNIVCTLIFNANGQLTSIAFNAPSRNGATAQTQSVGFSFTITGLDSGTGYDLTLTAKDNSGNTIKETTIPFQTDYPEGIEDVQSDEVQSTKVIKDGQVLILRNGKTYTMQGQEVK